MVDVRTPASLSHGAWPVDPGEFAAVFSIANRIFDQYEKNRFSQDGGDVKENIFLRIMDELKDWYHEEPREKFVSVCWRLFSLSRLIRTGALDPWIRRDPQSHHITIPEPVLVVAACLPLRGRGGFDPQAFVRAVTERTTHNGSQG